MHWRVKAAIQNSIARLPDSWSYPAYYWVQRRFGTLRRVDPLASFRKGAKIAGLIEKTGRSVKGASFLEVGTGRRVNLPLSFWLMGASQISTVDLNPYLTFELILQDLRYIAGHRQEIAELLGEHLQEERLADLTRIPPETWSLGEFLKYCRIEYLSPADAANLRRYTGRSFDYHVSCNVFEHIPPDSLRNILMEGSRILKEQGMFLHRIDHSDHFSHSDKTISALNFLQYDAKTWARIAGNRYMYMNRLREDDYEDLFAKAGLKVLFKESDRDPALKNLLDSPSFHLDSDFKNKSPEVLITTGSWLVAALAEYSGPAIVPES